VVLVDRDQAVREMQACFFAGAPMRMLLIDLDADYLNADVDQRVLLAQRRRGDDDGGCDDDDDDFSFVTLNLFCCRWSWKAWLRMRLFK
jgi:hypothetical protein